MKNISPSNIQNPTGAKLLGLDSAGAPCVITAASITAQGNPYKSYATKALATTDLANIPADALIYVNADSTAANNGFWTKTGGVLVQSSYDRVAALETSVTNMSIQKSGVPVFMNNDNATGTLTGNKISFSTTDVPGATSGFTFHTGTIDPYIMDAIREIKRTFNVEPYAYVIARSENLTLNKSCEVKRKSFVALSYPALVSSGAGTGLTKFEALLPISDLAYYADFKIMTQAKQNASLTAYLEIVSAAIYYKEEKINNYLLSRIAKREDSYPMLNFKDIDSNLASGVSIVKADDSTLLITIPKGTLIPTRAFSLPLKGFHFPLLEAAVLDKFIVEVIAAGVDFSTVFSFREITVASATAICANAAVSAPYSKNYQNTSNRSFVAIQTTSAGLLNFHNANGYDSLNLTIGNLTAGYAAATDLTFTLRLRILTLDESYRVGDTLQRIESKINRLSGFMGEYETQSKPACKGLISYTIPETATIRSKGVLVPNAVSEAGTVLEYLFNSNEYRLNGINKPTFNCSFICNRFLAEDISLTAEVVSLTGIKIQDAVIDYGEIYNGVIKVSFELFENVSTIESVKLKITLTSTKATGLDFYLFSSEVQGLAIERTVAERLYDLNYTIKDTVIKSSTGKKFRLAVDDSGVLSTLPYTPSKMMVLSHSWGLIPAQPSIGWYGNWSLCSSTLALGLHSQIETQIKTVIPELTAFYQRFATFAQVFKTPSAWGEFNMSHLDFDSIMILSFAAGPADSDWTGFGLALVNCINNYVCAGKTGVKVYIGDAGNVPDVEFQIAVSAFGTTEIDTTVANSVTGQGWPWKMPVATDGTPITKVQAGQPPSEYVMSGDQLGHPGNYGYYVIAKKLKNQIATDYSLVNSDPTVLTFDQYKVQPAIAPYLDPLYPYA